MKLKVLIPTAVVLDREVGKVVAEGADGAFCLLPRHIDFASALVQGILTFETPEGWDEYVAVNEGILVKAGDEVLVSARDAVHSEDLASLRETVEKRFQAMEEGERATRTAVARLEADMIRRFMELGRYARP